MRAAWGRLPGLEPFGYVGAAVALTWPLVLRLGEAVPGVRGDQATYLWGIDTLWREVLAGRVPLWTERIFYPESFRLWETTAVPLLALGAVPGVPQLAYYSVVVLAAIVLAGVGMCRLLRELEVPALPAFVAGLLWITTPPVVHALSVAHLSGLSAGLLPWGVLAIERLRHGITPGRLVAALIVPMALLGLTVYVALLFVVMGGIIAWARVPRLALAGTAVAAVVVVGWPAVDLRDLHRGLEGWWSAGSAGLERIAEVGPVVGVLALVGMLARPFRRGVPYVAAGLVVWLVAAGSVVRLGARTLWSGPWTPWNVLMRWEPLTALDTPNRLLFGTSFIAVVLAGLAMGRVRWAWLVGVAGVVLVWQPLPLYVPPVPEIVHVLAAEPDDGTLLMLPGGFSEGKGGFGYQIGTNNEAMYWQTLHGKRRVGGHVSRQRHSRYLRALADPVLGELLLRYRVDYQRFRYLHLTPTRPITREAWQAFVRRYDIRWIWLLPDPDRAQTRGELLALAPDARVIERQHHTLLTLR